MEHRPRPLDIAFLHPDLGIGGAERLVVDACLELATRGHAVALYTAHHDHGRCFPETVDGRVEVRAGRWTIPPALFDRARVICSIARLASAFAEMRRRRHAPDLIFCDLVPHLIPWIRRRSTARMIYYCHFPDRLLTPPRRFPYSLYRVPFDRLERRGTERSDAVLVNSLYTASAFARAYPGIPLRPRVIYPGINVAEFSPPPARPRSGTFHLLSLNRFEPGKRLELAIECLAWLRRRLAPERFGLLRLTLAGGFDPRLASQRRYVRTLEERVASLGLGGAVTFRFSVSRDERRALLAEADCLLYTAPAEHFGIGVVEGMAAALPVVAVAGGGPLEILEDGVSGFLRDAAPAAFGGAVLALLDRPPLREALGGRARERAERFSRKRFGDRLSAVVEEVVAFPPRGAGSRAGSSVP